MPAIKAFTISYETINEDRIFSEGDRIRGWVSLDLIKQTNVETLFVKAKGDAIVEYKRSKKSRTCTAEKRYFKLKQIIIQETPNGTILNRGVHVYSFTFHIPVRSMPSSTTVPHGRIVYKLEAKLVRSSRVHRNVEKEFTFVSKTDLNPGKLRTFQSPQHGEKKDTMHFYTQGSVSIEVDVERLGYKQGETVQVTANVNNSSSRDLRPKFVLEQIISYIFSLGNSTAIEKTDICKVVGEPIRSKTQRTVVRALRIPTYHLPLTLLNCDLLRVEYQVKVYLDVPLGLDPEVRLPLVIVPACYPSNQPASNPRTSQHQPASNPGASRHRPASNPGVSRYPSPAFNPGASRYPPSAFNPGSSRYPPPAFNPGASRHRPAFNTEALRYPPPTFNTGASQYPPPAFNPGASRHRPAFNPEASRYPPPAFNPGASRYPPPAYNPGASRYPPPAFNPGASRHSATSSPRRNPKTAPTFNPPPTAPTFNPPPTTPMFNPPPTAQTFNTPPTAPTFNTPPTAPTFNTPPTAPMFNTPATAPTFNTPPTTPAFNPSPATPPPSYASMFQPTLTAPTFNPTPSAPTFNVPHLSPVFHPSAAAMLINPDLSEENEQPPSYLSLYPSAAEASPRHSPVTTENPL